MFKTLSTLIAGVNARSEDRVRDAFAIELIDQKIREAETSLKAAKATLASLIQRQRSEERQRDALKNRIKDMMTRAQDAMDQGRDDLAGEAAQAVAQMENELTIRTETCDRLDQKVIRLRNSIEAGHRRIIDLKQGAIQARAVRREQAIQSKLNSTIGRTSNVEEAEELIGRVMGKDDPFEQSEILREIDRDLGHETLADRMADQGFGPATRTTADDVLARLKTKKSA
ncbi:phage shock protein A (PspA) family protein [Octadecabacter temperatus]|uniref:PspA/IM30 family protein n=1 Tax=Octadecabacter temperatus TaxID=1458307 RepID=A0A0K0Y7R9_9RHOB|nr:PspA/IM30 family protein [Octadecabacter temperatus]AKS47019.1 PspA/IM30 family protein [Octadecabacter temperatus]SIO25307.1 phage shock protein A (PspA) family protein [Octadecabacter temperatus]